MILNIKSCLRDISLWKSVDKFYLSGYDSQEGKYYAMEILYHRSAALDGYSNILELREDNRVYNSTELKEKMKSLNLLEMMKNIRLIFGFIKTIDCYHLVLVTKEEIIGEIHGNAIYTIKDTSIIPLSNHDKISSDEQRYRNLLQKIDFKKGFYYSFTYDITRSLQQNSTASRSSTLRYDCNDMFAWNYYTSQPFLALPQSVASRWITPCIYGYIHQFYVKLRNSTRTLKYTLISRRSRHFAGTRNLRRGTNYEGYVANEIETEQILTILGNALTSTRSSSLVQHRGSIPLFWSHTNIFAPNPEVQLEPMDCNLCPTNKHFLRLFRNFGGRVLVLNYIRQDYIEREILLGNAYVEACSFLNRIYTANQSWGSVEADRTDSKEFEEEIAGAELVYVAYDMLRDNHHSADGKSIMISKLNQLSQKHFHLTGFFTHASSNIEDAKFERFDQSTFAADMYLKLMDENSKESADKTRQMIVSEDEYDTKSILSELERSLSVDDYHDTMIDTKLQSYEKSDGLDEDIMTQAGNAMINWYNNFQVSVLAGDHALEQSSNYQTFESETSKVVRDDDKATSAASVPPSSDIGIGEGCPHGLLQYGVIRSNCVDCLDRTNIGQFCYAKTIFPMQLMSLGISLTVDGLTKLTSKVMSVWVSHGDAIAQQYGGSPSMHKLDETTDSGKKEIIVGGGALNAVTAMQRYYSNISTDFERQQGMDLLLGVFIPTSGYQHVWEVDQKPQNMRYPSSIESCLIPFPLNVQDDKNIDREITSFRKFEQDAFLYGAQVDGLDDVEYMPYPNNLVPLHARLITQTDMLASESSMKEKRRDKLIQDLETTHMTNEQNKLYGHEHVPFNCYGSDDIYGLEKANYASYLQDATMAENISAKDLTSASARPLSGDAVTRLSKGNQSPVTFTLPLPSEFQAWLQDPANWQRSDTSNIESKLVTFPKFESQSDGLQNSLRIIPTYGYDLDAGSDDGSTEESGQNDDVAEVTLLPQSPTNESLHIAAVSILGADAVDSISQPFKWFFQNTS